MPELSEPMTLRQRHHRRAQAVMDLVARKALLELQLRQELFVLSTEDTEPGDRKFVADELALLLDESPGTCDRWVQDAQLLYLAAPELVEKVVDGSWSVRHLDAVLDEICLLDTADRAEAMELVLSSDARTPHELRQATRAAALAVDPSSADRRASRAKTDRAVRMVSGSSGNAALITEGPKEAVAAMMAAIDAACLPTHPDDTRTLAQRRFDYVRDAIAGQVLPSQWQALVVVPLSTLEGTSNDPAEIPGLGMITAGEAREIIAAGAELRRAVVDENGVLVSLDTTVHKPDLTPGAAANDGAANDGAAEGATDGLRPERRPTDQVQPADDLDALGEDESLDPVAGVSEGDQAWWIEQLSSDPSLLPVPPDLDVFIEMTMGGLDHALRGLMTEMGIITAGVGLSGLPSQRDPRPAGSYPTVDVFWPRNPTYAHSVHGGDDTDGDPDDPGGSGDGGGGSKPPPNTPKPPADNPAALEGGSVVPRQDRPPPDQTAVRGPDRPALHEYDDGPRPSGGTHHDSTPPEPTLPAYRRPQWRGAGFGFPSTADQEWVDRKDDLAGSYQTADDLFHHQATRPRPTTRAVRDPGAPPPEPDRAWTMRAMRKALTRMRTDKPLDKPLPTSAYAFPARAARFIKARDITCVFPGCPRLARYCQNDHVRKWPEGKTDVENAGSECVHHHQAKHHYFTVIRLPDGTVRWTTPYGHSVDRRPRPFLRGW